MASASSSVVSLTCPRRRPLIAKDRGTTLFRADYLEKRQLWSWRWLCLGESPSIQFHKLGGDSYLCSLSAAPVSGIPFGRLRAGGFWIVPESYPITLGD
jgi:hypothetical protein